MEEMAASIAETVLYVPAKGRMLLALPRSYHPCTSCPPFLSNKLASTGASIAEYHFPTDRRLSLKFIYYHIIGCGLVSNSTVFHRIKPTRTRDAWHSKQGNYKKKGKKISTAFRPFPSVPCFDGDSHGGRTPYHHHSSTAGAGVDRATLVPAMAAAISPQKLAPTAGGGPHSRSSPLFTELISLLAHMCPPSTSPFLSLGLVGLGWVGLGWVGLVGWLS